MRKVSVTVAIIAVLLAAGPTLATPPTAAPTAVPSAAPTEAPTAIPTAKPTQAPSAVPTSGPTAAPTAAPTIPVCTTGFYRNTNNDICTACEAGSYQNSTNATSCLGCRVGTYSRAGASTCTLCAPGKYASDVNSTECTKCAKNTYINVSGWNGTCPDCPPGYVGVADGLPCGACGPGKYSDTYAADACIDCDPAFQWSVGEANTECVNNNTIKPPTASPTYNPTAVPTTLTPTLSPTPQLPGAETGGPIIGGLMNASSDGTLYTHFINADLPGPLLVLPEVYVRDWIRIEFTNQVDKTTSKTFTAIPYARSQLADKGCTDSTRRLHAIFDVPVLNGTIVVRTKAEQFPWTSYFDFYVCSGAVATRASAACVGTNPVTDHNYISATLCADTPRVFLMETINGTRNCLPGSAGCSCNHKNDTIEGNQLWLLITALVLLFLFSIFDMIGSQAWKDRGDLLSTTNRPSDASPFGGAFAVVLNGPYSKGSKLITAAIYAFLVGGYVLLGTAVFHETSPQDVDSASYASAIRNAYKGGNGIVIGIGTGVGALVINGLGAIFIFFKKGVLWSYGIGWIVMFAAWFLVWLPYAIAMSQSPKIPYAWWSILLPVTSAYAWSMWEGWKHRKHSPLRARQFWEAGTMAMYIIWFFAFFYRPCGTVYRPTESSY
jgi:hypothetical protein